MKLYLGCGPDIKPGFEHRDRQLAYDVKAGWTFESGLPYSNDSVDCITISHSLMYVKETDWSFVFSEFYRVLKPAGVIRITEDDIESPTSSYYQKPWPGANIETGPNLVRRYLEGAGFKTLSVTARETLFKDDSILVLLREGHSYVFYIEGLKA